MKNILAILLVLAGFQPGMAQIIHESGEPLGLVPGDKSIQWYNPGILKSEIDELRSEAARKKDLLRFGIVRQTDLNPDNSGLVSEHKGDFNTWHLCISSADAASLAIVFSSFALKESEKVFIYDPGMKNVLGPFTSRNNKESGILPLAPLEGSELIVEYQFRKKDGGKLEVGQVGHDALGIFGYMQNKDEDFGTSGPCNVDINCDSGTGWEDEKRAVVKLVITDIDFIYLGSASMVNNTAYDNIPYILTAEHVLQTSFQARRTVTIFNYESPWCDGPDGSILKSISGADLVATNPEIDITLIKLSEFPPIIYKPYMAGWDVSGNLPQNTISIHHPSGDVKKISADYDQPLIASFENLVSDGFWKILQWDEGTTEGGSSGSPLFNENHRIVGTLTGGEAVCGNSVNDYYARLDIAWDLSESTLNSLKPWLDNKKLGNTTLSGRDPYANNYADSDTLFNGSPDESFITAYDGGGTGLTTGTNSDSLLAYAEKFTIDSPYELTDVFLYIASSNYVSSNDSVSIYLYDDNNGPGNIIATTKVLIKDTRDNFLLRADFGRSISLEGTFYIAYRNWYRTEAESEPRQFAVYHGSPSVPGSDHAWFQDNTGWYPFSQHPFDPYDNSLYIKAVLLENSTIVGTNNITKVFPGIRIYPNPFVSSLIIETEEAEMIIESVRIMDMLGREIRHYKNINSTSLTIADLASFSTGLYFVDLFISGQHRVYSLIKE